MYLIIYVVLISKFLRYHRFEACINYARSTSNLTKEVLFTHYKSVTVDLDSIFGNSIVPKSEFFQYIFELDVVFNKFFKKFIFNEHVSQKLKTRILFFFFIGSLYFNAFLIIQFTNAQ